MESATARKMVFIATGLTAVSLCGRAPAKRGRKRKGNK